MSWFLRKIKEIFTEPEPLYRGDEQLWGMTCKECGAPITRADATALMAIGKLCDHRKIRCTACVTGDNHLAKFMYDTEQALFKAADKMWARAGL